MTRAPIALGRNVAVPDPDEWLAAMRIEAGQHAAKIDAAIAKMRESGATVRVAITEARATLDALGQLLQGDATAY